MLTQNGKTKNREAVRALVIPGAYVEGVGFSFDHCTEFQLKVDGVVMTTAALKSYFSNNRTLPNASALKLDSASSVYRQVYYSGVYLYNFLSRAGFATELLNCFIDGDRRTTQAFEKEIDAVVISTTFTWCPQVRSVVKSIRRMRPDVKIIIGGRWVYDSYRVLLKSQEKDCDYTPEVLNRYFFTGDEDWRDVDLFIVGEHGEDTLLSVLDNIGNGDDYRHHTNCAYWNESKLIFTERSQENFSVDNLAIAWDKIPERYQSSTMPLVAGIGCPFRCKFCDYSLSKLYYKPFKMLRDELVRLQSCRYVSTAWFIDDNFLYNESRIMQFCEMWQEQKFRLKWYGIIRLDSITEVTAKALAETGLKMIMVGVESGSPTILKNMNKKVTVEQYRRAFDLLSTHGIRAKILLVIGFPGENEETIAETISFINSLPRSSELGHEIFLSPLCVLPLANFNTKEDRDRFGMTGYLFDWQHTTMGSGQVYAAMQRIFLETRGVYQYYPDNNFDLPIGEERQAMINIARTREELRKAQIRGDGALEHELWERLEEFVMGPHP